MVMLKVLETIRKSQRLKKKMFDKENNGFKAEYVLLYGYIKELEIRNSHTTTNVKIDGEKKKKEKISYFDKFYICFQACKQD